MNPAISLPTSPEEELAHSFRKRRLTYSRHHIQDSAAAAALLAPDDLDDDDRARTEAANRSEPKEAAAAGAPAGNGAGGKRKRPNDAPADRDAADAPRPKRREARKRILHSGEIERSSRSRRLGPRGEAPGGESKWRRRFSFCGAAPDGALPFPRSAVGTYSCRGMEPACDSDYDDSSDEEREEAPRTVRTVAKINQDRGGIAYPYAHRDKCALFMIYDGHGEGGEMVSQYALGEVQRLLEERLVKLPGFRKRCSMGKIEEGSVVEEDGDGRRDEEAGEEEERLIKEAFRETFVQVDRGLLKESDIEPMYSGTTACVALLHHDKLYISNAGDSRAVLARRSNNKSNGKPTDEKEEASLDNDSTTSNPQKSTTNLIAIPLSIDQNPDSPGEKERILASGGFVSPPPEPGLSARVWLDPEYTQIGLAMARSIGDHAVKGVGVVAEPVVTVHQIAEEDEFVILATDGVWEFMENEDAVRIVSECLFDSDKDANVCASAACEALIKAAMEKWHEYEGDYRDDITAIVVRLKDLWGFH